MKKRKHFLREVLCYGSCLIKNASFRRKGEVIMTLTINSAIFASNNKGIDVTAIVQKAVSSGSDDIVVACGKTALFPVDPDPGHTKWFGVSVTGPGFNGGNPYFLGCREGTSLDLAPTSLKNSSVPQNMLLPVSGIATVNFAFWASTDGGNDVTASVQSFLNNGAKALITGDAAFQPDPNPGQAKCFVVSYTYNGTTYYIGTLNSSNSLPFPGL